MRTYDEIWADAKDEPAFSNGTEGYGWTAANCGTCKNDSPELVDKGEGCPLILVSLMQRTPVEWLDQKRIGPNGILETYGIDDQYHCVEFRDQDEPGGEEPTPVPTPPGQGSLFDREPVEGVRMYADVASEARPAAVTS